MCWLICILGMATSGYPKHKYRLAWKLGWIQLFLLAGLIIFNISSLFRLHTAGFFFYTENVCRRYYEMRGDSDRFDVKIMKEHIEKVLEKMESLQLKVENDMQNMERDKDILDKSRISMLKVKNYLEEEVVRPLINARFALKQIPLPRVEGIRSVSLKEEPLVNEFKVEELRKYITPKENRKGKANIFKTEQIHNTIGHPCVLVKKELEDYMEYEVGSYCKSDWKLAQKLMLKGCDPLPRRRCLTRTSNLSLTPHPISESLWKIPNGGNLCVGCFEMEREKLKWVNKSSTSISPSDFLIQDVLSIKPREIRIGLDYSLCTGTFAAKMKQQNVAIISTALNLEDAPFNEIIAFRGLVPLYITPNQRLPFFENTMDLIHTTGFLDGSIDMLLLDFVLYDWDRVLRPGGLLWIDEFSCDREHLDDYMYLFLQFRYKKHKWVVASKSDHEVYLSALLEKPPRSV